MFIFKDHYGASPFTSSRGARCATFSAPYPFTLPPVTTFSRGYPFTSSATDRITTRFLDVV